MNEELPLILVIDDEEKLRSGLELFLKKSGFSVKTATDGNRGLIMAQQLNPDVILCDVMMPEMDGFELQNGISADPLINHIPFIFLSARTASDDMMLGFENGADDYISKPFNREELLARLNAVLRRVEKTREIEKNIQSQQISKFKQEFEGFQKLINLQFDFYSPIEEWIQHYCKKDISVEYDVDDDLEIFAARSEFTEAVLNLVDNAIKFSPDNGHILIELSRARGGGFCLTVTNLDLEIPDGKISELFELFYENDESTTDNFTKFGMGLIIARAIAQSLGGDLELMHVSKGFKVKMSIPPILVAN